MAVIIEDKVECRLCGKLYRSITNTHLWASHGMEMLDYKKQFPDAPIESPKTKKINDLHRKIIANSENGLAIRSATGKSNKGRFRTQEFKDKRSQKYAGVGNPFYNKMHSNETKKKLSMHFQGVSENDWQGFTNTEKVRAWKSGKAKTYSKEVFKRDGFACQMCGTHRNLEAHHIITRAKAPELTYDVSNGITLCADCHRGIYGKETHYEERFGKMVRKNAFAIGEKPSRVLK